MVNKKKTSSRIGCKHCCLALLKPFFLYCTVTTPSHLFTLHTSAQYKSIYTRFTREWASTQITTIILKSHETQICHSHIIALCTSHQAFGYFLCFFVMLKDYKEEEVVHSHLPSRLSCQFEISASRRCLYRVGDKLWLPSTFIGM
jgi:hypothetical protein